MATKKKAPAGGSKKGRPTLGSSHKRPSTRAAGGRGAEGRSGPAKAGPHKKRARSDDAPAARGPKPVAARGARKPGPAPGGPLRPPRKARPPTAAAFEPSRKVPRPRRVEGAPVSEDTLALAQAAAHAACDKKALDVRGYDVCGRVDYADVLVLMSGRSDRHVASIADAIEQALGERTPRRKPITVEGRPQATWIILDYGDLVAHVFQEEARSHYDLDGIWTDARSLPLELS